MQQKQHTLVIEKRLERYELKWEEKKTGTQTEWKLSFPAANATYTKHAGWTGEKWKMFINKCKNVNCTLVQHRSSIWMELGRTAELEPTFFFFKYDTYNAASCCGLKIFCLHASNFNRNFVCSFHKTIFLITKLTKDSCLGSGAKDQIWPKTNF